MAALFVAAMLPLRTSAGGETMARPTNTPQSKVNIIYAEATGSFIVLLAVAERQGFSKSMV
jgi:hypothetical protein